MKIRRFVGCSVIFATLCMLAACSGSTSSGGGNGGDGGGGGGEAIPTTAGELFPADLALSSPYAQTTVAGSLVVRKGVGKEIADYETERTEVREMLAGTTVADCAFSMDIFRSPTSASCYGPTVNYSHYPGEPDPGEGGLPPYDLGIWGESMSNGEACAAAKINELAGTVGRIVDSAVKIDAAMACMMNVNDRPKPEAGETLDLKTDLTEVITQNNIAGVTIDSATASRAAADSGGFPVYEYETNSDLSSTGRTESGLWVHLRHIPQNTENTLYKGKLSYLVLLDGTDGAQECQQGGVSNTVQAGTVLYEKATATSMTYKFEYAMFCGFTSGTLASHVPDYLDSRYNIDPTSTYSQSTPYGWVHDYHYGLFSFNPEDGTGTFAYAWQAGFFDGNTRVFNANLSADAQSGAKSGCAYFGYGPDMVGASNVGAITGMICNWTGPGGQQTHAQQLTQNQIVQRQCMDFSSQSGIYESVPVDSTDTNRALRIRYAPATSCNYAGGTFTYSSGQNMTNDVPTATEVFSNNLVAIPAFTLPTAPADVY